MVLSDKTGGMALWGNHASHCIPHPGELCGIPLKPWHIAITLLDNDSTLRPGLPVKSVSLVISYITYITNKQSPSLPAIIVVFISHCRVPIQVCYIFAGEACRIFVAESPKKPSQPSHTVNGRSPAAVGR